MEGARAPSILAAWMAVLESTSVTVSSGTDDWHVIFDKCLCRQALHRYGYLQTLETHKHKQAAPHAGKQEGRPGRLD
ncbi:hypothetical protein TREES_T100014900 [Tupaia chinensis]|uniref:Uncharacterized protein n=1 Tax=Tupaia chinensis TaxID=246437 RepID=L9KY60_TUPCH|nr:hypothetical protein TREES_T100014900 [Tupaia chinensis]